MIINIGKPIDYSNAREEAKYKEEASKLTRKLMEKIVKLRDEDPKVVKRVEKASN